MFKYPPLGLKIYSCFFFGIIFSIVYLFVWGDRRGSRVLITSLTYDTIGRVLSFSSDNQLSNPRWEGGGGVPWPWFYRLHPWNIFISQHLYVWNYVSYELGVVLKERSIMYIATFSTIDLKLYYYVDKS